jgi:hypothetical protein
MHYPYRDLVHPTLMNEGDEKHILYMSLCIHSFDYVIVCHFHPYFDIYSAELFELLAPILPFSGCASRLDHYLPTHLNPLRRRFFKVSLF